MARGAGASNGRLLAFLFDDPYKADDVRVVMHRMVGEGLSDVDETAVVVRKADGHTRVTQDLNLARRGQTLGHMASLVASAVTGATPFILVGSTVGRVVAHLSVHDLTRRFVRTVSKELRPGTSALILLVRSDDAERYRIAERIRTWQPRIVEAALPADFDAEIERTFLAV